LAHRLLLSYKPILHIKIWATLFRENTPSDFANGYAGEKGQEIEQEMDGVDPWYFF
jgi:hypothetical protein